MKKNCSQYTSEEISRFVDNELGRKKMQAVKAHIECCSQCRKLADNYRFMTEAINVHAQKHIHGIDSSMAGMKLTKIMHKSENRSYAHIPEFFGRYAYLKIAAIAVIAVASGFLFMSRPVHSPVAGPSAIVKSVDTNFDSVMIIETQKQKHTIIWFSET